MANLEKFIDKLVSKVLNEELDRKINSAVQTINEKEDKWIQDVDMKEGAFTKYCGGEVTCECAKKALDKGGHPAKMAQLYLNMNKDKCKSLQEGNHIEEVDEMEDNYEIAQKRRKEREMRNAIGNTDYIKNMPDDDEIGVYSDNSTQDGLGEMGEEMYGSFGHVRRKDKKGDTYFDEFDRIVKDSDIYGIGDDEMFDTEEFETFKQLYDKYGDKQKWFGKGDGERMFDLYRKKTGKPFKVKTRKMQGEMGEGSDIELEEKAKPDFLDLDNDGNKKEPMKKAAKDAKNESKKKVLTLSEEEMIELIEKILEEQFVSGQKETKNSLEASKKENNENLKAVAKKMNEYLKDGSEGDYDANPKSFPKGNGEIKKSKKMAYQPSKAVEEYIENFAYAPGMENLMYDEISPNEDWVEMNIEGNSKTGNSAEYANAVETPLGKAINKKRKENLFGKEKLRSYNRVKQPVDVTGNSQSDDTLDKMFGKLNSESKDEKKENLISEEMNKMKKLISYSQKTQ